MRRHTLVLAALALSAFGGFAAGVSAQQPPADRKFLEGPAGYIATDDEKKAFSKAATDADAAKLAELFWARRDPTPGTFVNEFRDDFWMRVEAADKLKDVGGVKTDKGMVFVILGPPSGATGMPLEEWLDKSGQKAKGGGRGGSTGVEPGGGALEPPILSSYRKGQATIWRYAKDKLPAGYPDQDVTLVFVTEEGRGENQLERDPRTNSALELAKKEAIKSPDMKEVPAWAKAAPPPPPPPAAASVATIAMPFAGWLSTAFFGEPAGMADKGAIFQTHRLTMKSEPFSSFLLVTTKAAIPAGETKLFGEVRDAAGTPVARFLAEGAEGAGKDAFGDLAFGRSVDLAPGKYKVAMGVGAADGSALHVVRTADVEVPDLKDGSWKLESMLVTKGLLKADKPQPEKEPFCYMGNFIYPTFTPFSPTDSLFSATVVFNPSVDAARSQPAMTGALILKPAGSNKPIANAPATEVFGLSLSDPNGWLIINPDIPLAQIGKIRNGGWRLEVDVKDDGKAKKERIGAEFRFAGGKDPEPEPAPKGKSTKKK